MKKILFIDRDGTLILEPEDYQVDGFSKLKFYPGVLQWLARIAATGVYELVMVTNQDGLGTSSFPESDFWPVQQFVIDTLAAEGIVFSNVLIDRSFEHENPPTRKPGIGMLVSYCNSGYDLAASYVIGDRLTDVQLAKNLGARAIALNPTFTPEILEAQGLLATQPFVTDSWQAIYNHLFAAERVVTINRNTRETSVLVMLNLDGTGEALINTGLKFFDHMLEQVGRHSGCDLDIIVKGDLEVDEHHTIEDTALALGQAFHKALADKLGIERYGFCLPMDDCLATVALDFGGRSWLCWDASFTRECIGDMPTEMFFHFFKSLSDAAQCNLNIKAEGTNEHHKIESIFKALGRCIGQAVKRNGSNRLPTTKGIL